MVSRLYNAGQACTASKRFIVVDDVYDSFSEGFLAAMQSQTPGNPEDPETSFGPLSSPEAVRELQELVEDAVSHGATAVRGADSPNGRGAYFPATVLTDVKPGTRAYDEELFGPVAVLHGGVRSGSNRAGE